MQKNLKWLWSKKLLLSMCLNWNRSIQPWKKSGQRWAWSSERLEFILQTPYTVLEGHKGFTLPHIGLALHSLLSCTYKPVNYGLECNFVRCSITLCTYDDLVVVWTCEISIGYINSKHRTRAIIFLPLLGHLAPFNPCLSWWGSTSLPWGCLRIVQIIQLSFLLAFPSTLCFAF